MGLPLKQSRCKCCHVDLFIFLKYCVHAEHDAFPQYRQFVYGSLACQRETFVKAGFLRCIETCSVEPSYSHKCIFPYFFWLPILHLFCSGK